MARHENCASSDRKATRVERAILPTSTQPAQRGHRARRNRAPVRLLPLRSG